MTYHILIVDDEPIVRNGLVNFAWETFGFECVGACGNGREALEWLNCNAVDVVLTDIKMPGIDGVELSGHIQERYPDILVVLLTGYNEFSYAQRAIKSGVFDYLLKPAEDSEFENVLAKCTEALRERERSKELLHVLSHHFLLSRQQDETHLSDETWQLVQRQLSLRQEQPFRLLLACLVEESSSLSAHEWFGHWNFVRISKREWVSLSPQEAIESILQTLTEREHSISIGISSLKTNNGEISGAFIEANKALQHKFLSPDERIFHYDEHSGEGNEWQVLSDILKKIILLSNRLNALNPGRVEEQLSEIMNELESKEISEKQIKQFTVYYLPSIIGGSVAVAIMWMQIFGREGLINVFLQLFGIKGKDWIFNPDSALYTIVILMVWQFGSSMLIFLAGLKQVPKEMYEAVSIDGAGRWKTFLRITLPLISPVIFFNLVMQTIQTFQTFTQGYVITKGGPVDETLFMVIYIYQQAFSSLNMGYAQAISWVLLGIIGVATIINFAASRYWVHYEDSGGKKG
ncbi:response regulator [Paenibacillus sp. R14(2021)]|uniref:response regulator n=1 Tax=Paenibacillus sp. R14(2021) TaxID=2859228 RepID=UPI001C614D38|nr:response regulator [Paenibacillus sp. R14(2021)]